MNDHIFNPTILREYDIRGIVEETLFSADAEAIGRAFGTMVRAKGGLNVAVGRDGRLSSPDLAQSLIAGLVASGCNVFDIGRGPTPMTYYASIAHKMDGGVMITGSHNPPNHNGFKMVLDGAPFFGDDIRKLSDLAASGNLTNGAGSVRSLPMLDDYVARIRADYRGAKPLKVVWDAGNGAAGEALRKLTATLPGDHTVLYGDIDGTFPNHHPDPTEPENMVDLQKEVIRRNADIGFAFDGDGDRIGAVDGKGRILWGDQILALLAEDVLTRHPGAPIIADVKASQTLFDEIARMGGQPVMWKTGHSLIKTRMAEVKSPLAGEMSGHIFFGDGYYGFDDALYAAIRLLTIVSNWDKETLAERHDRMPKAINTPELRFDCPDEKKFDVISGVKTLLKKEGVAFNDIDGVRVNEEGGWWLLRASNTQAVLVARAEAPDTERLKTLCARLEAVLAVFGVSFQPGGH